MDRKGIVLPSVGDGQLECSGSRSLVVTIAIIGEYGAVKSSAWINNSLFRCTELFWTHRMLGADG